MSLTALVMAKQVDVVVFSFDRPLQLYAFLESFEEHTTNVGVTSVLYRASNDKYENGYQIVKERFPDVVYVRQENRNPKQNFKPHLMTMLKKHAPSGYLAFAVDDIVVKDEIDFDECATYLERYNAEGLHLRMGLNLNYCYPHKCAQPLPPHEVVEGDLCRWVFGKGTDDWKYPHSIDLCVYRTAQVVRDLSKLHFENPYSLENEWAARPDFKKTGLCYKVSKIVNFPLNLVSEGHLNRHMTEYPPEGLLAKFLEGKKMDIKPVYQIENLSAHMDYYPTFIER